MSKISKLWLYHVVFHFAWKIDKFIIWFILIIIIISIILKFCNNHNLNFSIKKMDLWTHIFHVLPHSMMRLIFIGKNLVLEKLESPLIILFFKRENKTK